MAQQLCNKVKLEFKIGNEAVEVEVELYKDTAPGAVGSFLGACQGSTKLLEGSQVKRIWKDELCIGGGVEVAPAVDDMSIAKGRKHDSAGLLSTRIIGGDSTQAPSQFYIFFSPYPWLDGRFLVFGKIADRTALYKLSQAGSRTGLPLKTVTINKCVVLP